IVPLVARGQTLGAMTFVTAASGRRYDRDDLAVAEELARRAALAVDNSRLHREAREADRIKGEFLMTLSHALRTPLSPAAAWPRRVWGDSARVPPVEGTLPSNAITLTPDGRGAEIRLGLPDGRAQIVVSDTGRGIGPDFLPFVFERFRQANSATTRTHGGLGLGLAIVRQLVELHGGTVRAESPGEGQGATFTVSLPIPTFQLDGAEGHGAPGKVDAPSLEGLRVLVVDDEADARESLTVVLEQCGAVVTAVASARDALSALAHQRPDILV